MPSLGLIGGLIGNAVSNAVNNALNKRPSSSSGSSSRPSSGGSSGSSPGLPTLSYGNKPTTGTVTTESDYNNWVNNGRPGGNSGSTGSSSTGSSFGSSSNQTSSIPDWLKVSEWGSSTTDQALKDKYGINDTYNPDVDYSMLLSSPGFLNGASSSDIMNAINFRNYKSLTEPGMSQYYNDQVVANALQYYNNAKRIEDEAQAQIDAQEERKAQLQAYYDAMASQIAQQYDSIIPTVNQSYDQNARQAYINNRLAQRDLPEQLAAAGLGGQGAAESSIVSQNNAYTSALMQNELSRQNALQEIANNRANALAGNATSAAQSMVDLATQLADERAQILYNQEQQRQNLINNYLNYGNMTGNLGLVPTLSAQEFANNTAYNNAMLEMNQQSQDRDYWLQKWQGMGTRGATAEIAAALGIPVGTVYGKGTYSPDYI